MTKLFPAALVAALALTVPVPAHADGLHYRGACRSGVVNDTTPGGTLGGQEKWRGYVNVSVVADDLGPISAGCGLLINGVDQGLVLTAPERIGATFAAGPLTYTATASDLVQIYTTVTTSAGTETCTEGACPTRPICADSICDVNDAIDLINHVLEQTRFLDEYVCPQLIALAPVVNDLQLPDVVYIDPDTGDTYLGGTTLDYLFWDCPPYVT